MNNNRRKIIRQVIVALQSEDPDFEDIEDLLAEVLDEETEAMDNMPERLIGSDRYTVMEESCELLEDAINEIDPDDPDCAESIIDLLEQIDGI